MVRSSQKWPASDSLTLYWLEFSCPDTHNREQVWEVKERMTLRGLQQSVISGWHAGFKYYDLSVMAVPQNLGFRVDGVLKGEKLEK